MKLPKQMPALIAVKESTNIESMAYDPESFMLFVMYKAQQGDDEGALYRYLNVPAGTWRRMQRSPSKGTFVWTNIKGKYVYNRWTGSAWKGQAALQKASAKRKRDAAKEAANARS